ncbi:hypothetical protein, partial [Brotocaccenecus cirricatena]|uniref:hypothetical protein n=1 Tax=Brotocaccenecus cirricatena TaxID=3064195 RepID=UPI0032C13E12
CMFSCRTMKPIGRCCEQGITGRNLSEFAAQRIFHRQARWHHRYENRLYEIMEVKPNEIQSEK